jgi:hypothetical protein
MQSAWPNGFHRPPPFVVHMSVANLGYDSVQKEMKEGFRRGKDLTRAFDLDVVQPPCLLKFAPPSFCNFRFRNFLYKDYNEFNVLESLIFIQ